MNKHEPVIERMRDLTNKVMGAREYEIQDLLRESSDLLQQYGDALVRLRTTVDAQAEDEGLWFVAETAAEAYLQQELRKLHAQIEALQENE